MESPERPHEPAAIGRLGGLKLLKSKTKGGYVACFPIDEDELLFGRHPDCHVRLYYPTVSSIHAKLLFRERKAFVQVLGTNGLTVNGEHVFPALPDQLPLEVGLSNGSLIEIQRKRFEFIYPPTQRLPIAVPPTPHTPRRRSLRMSMINSAQVFTPNPNRVQPSATHAEVLKSPVKVRGMDDGKEHVARMIEDPDHSIILEEGRDLIVVENVLTPEIVVDKTPSPPQLQLSPIRPAPAQLSPPPQIHFTPKVKPSPRRRSEISLHKAVLVRSAQRAMIKLREKEMQELEEREVEFAVSPPATLGRTALRQPIEESPEEEEQPEHPEPAVEEPTSPLQLKSSRGQSAIRRSLDAAKSFIPFSWGTALPPDEPMMDVNMSEDEQDQHVPEDVNVEGENEDVAEIQVVSAVRKPILNSFMTPQPQHLATQTRQARTSLPAMQKLGATPSATGGARRVPIAPTPSAAATELAPAPAKTPYNTKTPIAFKPPLSPTEKAAIEARRKSTNLDAMFPALPTFTSNTLSKLSSPAPPSSPMKNLGLDVKDANVKDLIAMVKGQAEEMRRTSMRRKASMSPMKGRIGLQPIEGEDDAEEEEKDRASGSSLESRPTMDFKSPFKFPVFEPAPPAPAPTMAIASPIRAALVQVSPPVPTPGTTTKKLPSMNEIFTLPPPVKTPKLERFPSTPFSNTLASNSDSPSKNILKPVPLPLADVKGKGKEIERNIEEKEEVKEKEAPPARPPSPIKSLWHALKRAASKSPERQAPTPAPVPTPARYEVPELKPLPVVVPSPRKSFGDVNGNGIYSLYGRMAMSAAKSREDLEEESEVEVVLSEDEGLPEPEPEVEYVPEPKKVQEPVALTRRGRNVRASVEAERPVGMTGTPNHEGTGIPAPTKRSALPRKISNPTPPAAFEPVDAPAPQARGAGKGSLGRKGIPVLSPTHAMFPVPVQAPMQTADAQYEDAEVPLADEESSGKKPTRRTRTKSKASTTTATTRGKQTRAGTQTPEDDADELDTIDQEESPAAVRTRRALRVRAPPTLIPSPPPAAEPEVPKKGTTRKRTVRGSKAEEADVAGVEGDSEEPTAKASGSGTTGKRSRKARGKLPSYDPPEEDEKENTPALPSPPQPKVSVEVEAPAKVTKTTGPRRVAKKTAPEPVEVAPEPVVATRMTRTRSQNKAR